MNGGHSLGAASQAPHAASLRSGTPAPKTPVLGWHYFLPAGQQRLSSIGDLPHRAYVTSGRAALLAALKQLGLAPGSRVLVPTYHCPTMVAPILQAGLQPVYFPIGLDGLPLLQGIDAGLAASAKAMFVAHYFGLPKGLHEVLRWCTERDIRLVEDCAHSYFGQAGDRPVGHWGDYATASISKFFPVPECGLLASAHRPLAPLQLTRPGMRAQLKAALDVIEVAQINNALTGVAQLAAPLLWLKNRHRKVDPAEASTATDQGDDDGLMKSSDMARTHQSATLATMALHRCLPVGRIIRRRRENFAALLSGLAGAPGAHTLTSSLPDLSAPYVCPLWIDGRERANAVYAAVRAARLPIFRWDRIWPGTPRDPQDAGSRWSEQVLQVLCHQDLSADTVAGVTDQLVRILHSH